MEILQNGITLHIPAGTFPLSTDSILLSDFVKLPKNAKVLDLGAGCGTLGVMLCAKDPGCTVTGIELDACAHEMALHNAETNGIAFRLTSICGDVNNISSLVKSSSFSVCISNPPYFSSGIKSQTLALARHEDACSMDTLFQAASWALKYGGDFFIVHKPERLAELFACAVNHKLQPKTLCLVRHRCGGKNCGLFAAHGSKGREAGPGRDGKSLHFHHCGCSEFAGVFPVCKDPASYLINYRVEDFHPVFSSFELTVK